MNQRFDVEKQTLVDFNPDEYKAAATKGGLPKSQASRLDADTGATAGSTVPRGRTTLRFGGVQQPEIKPTSQHMEHIEPRPVDIEHRPADIEPRLTNVEPRPAHVDPRPADIEPRPYPMPEEGVYIPPPRPTQPLGPNGEYPLPTSGGYHAATGYLVVDEPMAATPIPEAAAALHILATKAAKPKKTPEPGDMVPMNLRIPLYLKDAFFKTCRDKGTNPSTVLRNLVKSYCGL